MHSLLLHSSLSLCVTLQLFSLIWLLVFHRKDLCEAKPQTPSVFKFSDVLFALKSDRPPIEASQVCLTLGQPLGQVDLQSDVPPSRGISGQLDIWSAFGSGWPSVRCTPQVEASSDQEQYYIRSAWHLVSLWVRLTFSQTYPHRGTW